MQFFTSKKRKAKSPCSKPGRNEKGGKTIVEGSPSGKGTLDNYLVASQDEPLCAGRDSLARQDPVKRSLSVEIYGCINDECKRSSQSQVAKTLDASQKGMLEGLPRGAGVAVGGSGKGTPDLVQGAENTELKKFAADFLSLYCRYCTLNPDTSLLFGFLRLPVCIAFMYLLLLLLLLLFLFLIYPGITY